MKIHRLLPVIAFYLATTMPALANYDCTGKVSYLGLNNDGGVVVALQNSTAIHTICNLDSKGSFSMVPSACKATYGTLLTAKAMGHSVTLYYFDGYSCNTIPSWSAIPQFYFIQQT
jgi:hypothetical protein